MLNERQISPPGSLVLFEMSRLNHLQLVLKVQLYEVGLLSQ